MDRQDWSSARTLFVVQVICWIVVAVVMAFNVDLARGPEIYPTCPSVLTALTEQTNGIPFNLVGLAEGLLFIGLLWFLSGVLAGVYSRWPRFFLSHRVVAGRTMGPSARRAGPIVMAAGLVLLISLQIGCELTR